MSAHRPTARFGILGVAVFLLTLIDAGRATADEFWVAPTSQQDIGGLEIASNTFWPVTPIGAVRFALAIPNNLQTFQNAKVVLIPHAPAGASTLNVIVCPAQNGGGVNGACVGPSPQGFTGVANQLIEVDISAAIAPRIGTPGATYLAVLVYTAPTTSTDHVVGLRFRYAPVPPSNLATLGANTFTGIQTAPGFAGDGSNVTGVNATLLDGLDSTAFAITAHGHDVSQVTNAARLAGGNVFASSQSITGGNLDLDSPSSTGTGAVTKGGVRFLYETGGNRTFLGMLAGSLTSTGIHNTGLGTVALSNITTGESNSGVGSGALSNTSDGSFNTALGTSALYFNTSGNANTASGWTALLNNQGSNNTATGYAALTANSSGSGNIAVGHLAGSSATTGSNNIYLGANVVGVAGESNAIYVGVPGVQTKTTIAGIRGTTVAGAETVVIDASGRLGSAPISGPGPDTIGSAQVIDDSLTAADLGPDSVGTSELANDSVTAVKVAFNYAGSASEAGPALNSDLLDGLDSTAFARLSANTFTGTQTVDGGNLDLDASTATAGNITKNGTRFLHNFGAGAFNTFLGEDAGNFTMTGANNTGVGRAALSSNTTGGSNTAMGLSALFSNTTGPQNAAFGWSALSTNTGGGSNAAFGFRALVSNLNGGGNVAVGSDALRFNTIGSNNVGIGFMAGANGTNGTNNIYVGANVLGISGETGAIYIGNQGTQTRTVIAGIRGTPIGGGEMVVIDSSGRLGSSTLALSNAVGSPQVIDDSLTSDDLAPNSVGDSEVAFNYAGSSAKGGPASNLVCVACVDSSEVSFSFVSTGANTFTGTQTIDAGNVDLDTSTSTTGNITKNGVRFIHEFGSSNTFVGLSAGNFTMSGSGNTGLGKQALSMNTTGNLNTALGNEALIFNTTGAQNTALGESALESNSNGGNNTAAGMQALTFNTSGTANTATGATAMRDNVSGGSNTADGFQALFHNTVGGGNTAVGTAALGTNTSGEMNVAVGVNAGFNGTTGSNNIYLGSFVQGVAGESNTIYLGVQGIQNRTLVAGIRGTTTGVADAIPVVIDSNGQLGTVSSSRRFKEDIQDMADASDRLFKLHPVTFRYTKAFAGGARPIQFGLIAEEVAEVFPELAVRAADGEVETVHYETLNVLLLNEVQKQRRELEAQRERITALERRLDDLLSR